MESRRRTIFPRTGSSPNDAAVVRAPKRKLDGWDTPVDLKLPKIVARSMHRVFTPVEKNPSEIYQSIYLVDLEGKRPYCVAQEVPSKESKTPYRVVMIRRSADRAVVGMSRRSENILNIIGAFKFDGSIFTVFDRPGLPLSEIVVFQSPQLGVAQIKTISNEVLQGICFLSDAGFSFPRIGLDDINISEFDGQVKIDFDRATYAGPEALSEALPFKGLLASVMDHVPDRFILEQSEELQAFVQCAGRMTYRQLQNSQFLKDALPTQSLIPLVLKAEASVIPVQHIIGAQIEDLKDAEG